MRISDEIGNNRPEFLSLCREHGVKTLHAFGSSVRGSFDELHSDIDLLVDIDDPDPIGRGQKLISLWDSFEQFFHRKVDLLTDASIKNPVLRKSIDLHKILIYDRGWQQVSF